MGAGASIPDEIDEAKAQELAGDKFDKAKFDELATDGKITKAQFLEVAGPQTKCVCSKHGDGAKVTIAVTEADMTPAWLSNVLDTEVKSFDTKLCGQGQVGVTVLCLNIEYASEQPSMPKSLAVKMHGPGEEQRKNSGNLGFYHKEVYAYHDFNIGNNVPLVCPDVIGIWYDARKPYETMEYFNLIMVNLNEDYTPYDPGTGVLPTQVEWDEIFGICAKQHTQYWEDAKIKVPPFAVDASGVFKLSPAQEMLALTVGPNKIVEDWWMMFEKEVVPRIGEDILKTVAPCFAVAEYWKGENGAKLYHAAMKRLEAAPMTLIHGDVNPGNLWKSKHGKEGDDKYCFADWQLVIMGPSAWEFTTPQIGIFPGVASLLTCMQAYHANLCKLDPKIAESYPFDTFKMHVQCATIAFWQFIFAFVHSSAVVGTKTGEMDKDKQDYTWEKFMPGCFTMMAAAMSELEMEKFSKELLAE